MRRLKDDNAPDMIYVDVGEDEERRPRQPVRDRRRVFQRGAL